MRGDVKPVMASCQLPLLGPAEKSVTMDGPFREVMNYALAFEQHPDVLSVSVFYVQPWLDLRDCGCSVVVVTNRDGRLASELAENIADEFWRRRHEFKVELTPLQDAVQQAISAPRGPIILADGADAPSGGAPGDSPAILQALLNAGANVKTLINIVDPEAVDLAIRAGIDNVISSECRSLVIGPLGSGTNQRTRDTGFRRHFPFYRAGLSWPRVSSGTNGSFAIRKHLSPNHGTARISRRYGALYLTRHGAA